MTTWLPIATAPRDGTRVILFWPLNRRVEQGFYLDNSAANIPWSGWRVESMRPMPSGDPSHWQPLPQPPTERGE